MIGISKDPDPDRRAAAVLAIGDQGGEPRESLKDPWLAVRVCAALAPALAEDAEAWAVLSDAMREPRAFDVAFRREPDRFTMGPQVALIEAACRRLADPEALKIGVRRVVDTCSGWDVGRHTLVPFIRRFFPDGWPAPEESTSEQRVFIAAVAARDALWRPAMDGDAGDVLPALGLPAERAAWAEFAAATVYNPEDIIVGPTAWAVRSLPKGYFGVGRDDATLPDVIVALIRRELQDSLDAGDISSYGVEVVGPRTFAVEVVGAGLEITPGPRGRASEFAWTLTGETSARWRCLAQAAAVAKTAYATTRVAGTASTQSYAFARPLGPLEPSGPADVDGLRIVYELDELWLADDAELTS